MTTGKMRIAVSGVTLLMAGALPTAVVSCLQPGACSSDVQPDDDRDAGDTDDSPDTGATDDSPDTGRADVSPDADEGDTGLSIENPPDCETDRDEPPGLILSWQRDPTTTMTIDWHTDGDDPRETLCFRRSDDEEWRHEVEAQRGEIPHLERDRYRVELTELEPDSEYVFQVGEFEREFRFRTMPESTDDRPVTFASGGDVRDDRGRRNGWFVATNEVVMEFDPDFIVWGGDIAYGDGGTQEDHAERWRGLLTEKLDTLVGEDGRVVPVLAGIGNHEVKQGYNHRYDDFEATEQWREQEAPYFYSLFAFPGHPGYNVLDFADYLSIIMLDSRHNNSIDGEQTEWLESVLQERVDRGVDHVLPFWHYPAFPSKSPYGEALPSLIRQNWIPLFEEYGVEVAFQHKDHAFLRTHPIYEGEVDEDEGIVYLGNGNWGATLRDWRTEVDWYADEFASKHHAYITTISGDDIYSRAVDHDGEILHGYGEEIQ